MPKWLLSVMLARKLALPLIIPTWVVTLLVALYTCAMLLWFNDYYEFYRENGVQHALITTAFYRFYPAGVPILLLILGWGMLLLRKPESPAVHLAWYSCTSFCLVTTWLAWVVLIEGAFVRLLFPA